MSSYANVKLGIGLEDGNVKEMTFGPFSQEASFFSDLKSRIMRINEEVAEYDVTDTFLNYVTFGGAAIDKENFIESAVIITYDETEITKE